MGALALLASWGLYRYTDVLEHVPFARALDWCAEKSAGLVRQPWATGLTGAVMLAAIPAAAIGILMGLGAFISWPISVVVVLLCMGPMRLVELPAVGSQAEGLASSLSPQRYHALAARDVVGAIVWAAILGAPGAVFYRAARESAESPVAALADQASLMTHARQLFGCMYWLPARVYAVALVVSGSGGRLEQLSKLSSDASLNDQLIANASGEQNESVANGPRAMLLSVLAVAVIVFII